MDEDIRTIKIYPLAVWRMCLFLSINFVNT